MIEQLVPNNMKMKLVVQKGTSIKEYEDPVSIWAGESFLGYQKRNMASLPRDLIISTKRGTGGVRVSEYLPAKAKIPTGGCVISIGRGTGTRLL